MTPLAHKYGIIFCPDDDVDVLNPIAVPAHDHRHLSKER
jgi:hypothetical protein